MSDEFQQPGPTFKPGSAGPDRRRERRVDFAARCRLSVTSPAWALTNLAIEGTTQDITANGVRINFQQIDRERIAGWKDAVAGAEELQVLVELIAIQDFPPLRGQIVWTHIEQQDTDAKSVPGSVGIMFSILANRAQQELLRLIESLPAS